MSQSGSIKPLVWAAVGRAAPVALVLFAAYGIARWTPLLPTRSFGLFYGMAGAEWLGMVSLPILTWALWARTAKLALRVGLLLVLGVVGWGWLLTRPWVGFPVDKLALYRAYPFAAATAVVLAVVVAFLWRRSRRTTSGRVSPDTPWSRPGMLMRLVTGLLALVVAMALSAVWTHGPAAVVATLAGPIPA
jgi:hypothetical protein